MQSQWVRRFSGADIAFQDIQLHTHRNKSELHFMAGHTMLSVPLASILSIEKLVLRDIQSTEYEIITKEGGTITLDVFRSALVKTEIRRAVRERPLFKGEQP